MKKNLTLLCTGLTLVSSLVAAASANNEISLDSNPFDVFHHSFNHTNMGTPPAVEITNAQQSVATVPTTWTDLEAYLSSETNFIGYGGSNYTVPLFVIALRSIEQRHLAENTSTATRMKIFNEQLMFIVSTWGRPSTKDNGLWEIWYAQSVGWSPTRFTPIYQFIYNRAFPPTQPVVDEDKGCCGLFSGWFK